ncbi:hypothetical protein F5890DRAFT_1166762 [Lentinula detonsa]|uniref:Uncharacterized protein n=1 Tax=Lentinula detonsa TaxID=2804962 RepID=A0AA38Q179_9AGAR|nr:hypothetical protein F5890DRAFT_1166762 [Lentinula detonsa]
MTCKYRDIYCVWTLPLPPPLTFVFSSINVLTYMSIKSFSNPTRFQDFYFTFLFVPLHPQAAVFVVSC